MYLFYTCYYFVTGMNRGIKMIFVHRPHKTGNDFSALFHSFHSRSKCHRLGTMFNNTFFQEKASPAKKRISNRSVPGIRSLTIPAVIRIY